MAQVNISDLNEKTSLEDSDVFLVEGTQATYKITKKKLEEELNTGGSTEGTVDLSDYYNKQEINTQFEGIANEVTELANQIGVNITSKINLFDANNLVTSFVDNNGTTQNGKFTNYIKIEKGKKYVTNLNYTQFYYFNENKNCLSSSTYITSPVGIAGNGGYLLIKIPSNTDVNTIKVFEGTDIDINSRKSTGAWNGKRWLLIGDSISTDESNLADVGYGKLISRDLGMILTNIAVSGKTMKDAYDWIDNYSEQFDLITVMMGTNNQGYNCALGALNDSYYTAGTYDSNNSFYAQTQLLMEKLKTKYPKSVIIFLTPIKRTGCGDDATYNDDNGYFKKLFTTKEYRDVIIDCCNYYSIPYIDLYNCIDSRTETNRILYFMSATDGTHPNDLGHALFLAPVIRNGIEKHTPYYFNDWDNTGGSDTPDTPVTPNTYIITNNLTNVTNSNTATSVEKDTPYTATLIVDTDYTLSNVTVTMGDTDVTSTVYSNGNINITSVTGNIIIIASATKNTTGDTTSTLLHSYTNSVETIGDYEGFTDKTGSLNLTTQCASDVYCSRTNIQMANGKALWGINAGDSFSIVMTGYKKLTNYGSENGGIGLTGVSSSNVIVYNDSEAISSENRIAVLGMANGETDSVAFESQGRLKALYYDSDGTSQKIIANTSLFEKNTSVALALTYDSNTGKLTGYVDGVEACSTTFTSDTNLYHIDGINFDKTTLGTGWTFENIYVYKGITDKLKISDYA